MFMNAAIQSLKDAPRDSYGCFSPISMNLTFGNSQLLAFTLTHQLPNGLA
jgi:hypothetical protein